MPDAKRFGAEALATTFRRLARLLAGVVCLSFAQFASMMAKHVDHLAAAVGAL